MTTTVPNWTDNVFLIGEVLAAGSVASNVADLDLRGKRGAWVYVALGRIETDSVDAALVVSIRGMINNEAINHPNSSTTRVMNTTAADGNTTIDQNTDLDTRTVFVAATTNFAVGDRIYIGASDGVRAEFANVVLVNAGVSLVVDEDIEFNHTAVQADIVLNQADVFSRMWVGGGSKMSVQANYSSSAAGPDVYALVRAQTYDSDATT